MEIKTFQKSELNNEIGIVIGTRPGIIMFAPIIREFQNKNIPHFVIHTGQHYSPNMDSYLFEDLSLHKPDYRLEEVEKKKTHGGQTAAMLEGIETILLNRRPRIVLVGGDANTNLAGALAARKLHIGVGHVEAGERSYDWRMPEEHNRVIIDHISDYLFATNKNSVTNLKAENIRGKIILTGNPIVDASLRHLDIANKKSIALKKFNLKNEKYMVLTMHREENVDVYKNIRGGLQGVSNSSKNLGLRTLFLVHPRTRKRLQEFGLTTWVKNLPGIKMVNAVRYLDFLTIIANASLIFTDSGGVQQEACIHHVSCVTLRENTEWEETITINANRLAGCCPNKILKAAMDALPMRTDWVVPFGNGTAAINITNFISNELEKLKSITIQKLTK